ncbi:MAG: nitrogen fixation protein FixH [Hyphomicrobiales bacterium]|nr:MAG: nitrogen fixation protein FixH [Hyphomicrobiales bacterium]
MSELTGKPITGRHVLIGLIIFFLVVATANGVLMWYAMKSWSGLEVESSYEAGREFPDEIAAARQQETKGWKVGIETERDASSTAQIRVTATDAGDTPINGLSFTGQLTRPINSAQDHQFALEAEGRGVYVASIDGVEPGQWTLIVEAKDGEERVFRSRNKVFFRQ